jgi:hypothetical protein
MNLVLWVMQVLLAVAFFAHGWLFLTPPAALVEQTNALLPRGFQHFVGVAEVLAAVGLTLPGLTRILLWLFFVAGLMRSSEQAVRAGLRIFLVMGIAVLPVPGSGLMSATILANATWLDAHALSNHRLAGILTLAVLVGFWHAERHCVVHVSPKQAGDVDSGQERRLIPRRRGFRRDCVDRVPRRNLAAHRARKRPA